MSKSLGRHQVVGFGRQTGRGSGATADYWLHKTAWSENSDEKQTFDTSALGVNAATSGVDIVGLEARPTISAYLDIASYGLLAYHNGDTYADSEVETGVYDHETKVGTTTYSDNFLTLNVDDAKTDGDQDFLDAILNTLSLNMTMDERVAFEASFVSQYRASGTNTAAFTAPQYFTAKDITVKFAATVNALSGASAASVKDGSLSLNNNVNDNGYIFDGGNTIEDHHMQERMAKLTFSQFAEDLTFKDYAKNGTLIACEIVISDTTTTIGAASNPTVTYTFPACSVAVARTEDNAALRTEDLTLTAHYGEDDVESASYLYKTVVRNEVADYSVL